MKISADIAALLEEEAARINRPEFIGEDPVQFPRRYGRQEDIEVTALLSATIAWGRRSMICRDAEKMLGLMGHEPYRYMMEKGYEDLDAGGNIHRTFFGRHLAYYLRGLREIYAEHGNLDAFSRSIGAGEDEAPAWKFAEELRKRLVAANGSEDECCRCVPGNMEQTALKRINMALRWLVRDDGIVDMGIWRSIPKSKLYIPLDVHVGNTARDLGLLERRSNDRKAVEQLTAAVRTLRPEDPALYDYALFGIGVEGKKVAD